MSEALASARTPKPDGGNRLNLLVDRIAAGDRAEFRCLYAFLAMRVWRDAVRVLPDPADARAVTRAAFVEVWHLAGHHLDHSRTDPLNWISAIVARQIRERLRGTGAPFPVLGDHDRHVHRELALLLGAGPAMIRIGPATFTRVDDLNFDLATVAWARLPRGYPAGIGCSRPLGVAFWLGAGW